MDRCLVFFDIDGTLLFHNTEVAESDVQALHRLQAAGHKIFLNSGRSRGLVPRELTDRISFDGFLCGCTYVEYGGEVLHRVCLDDDTVRGICRYAKENGWRMLLECEGDTYGINGGCFHPSIDITEVLESYLEAPGKMRVTKFTIDRDIEKDIAALFPDLRFVNFGGFSEGIALGYDKSFGMRLLAEKLSVPRECLVAFGDSVNDTEMLAYAGQSVIMHSAPTNLDALATLRASCNKGGVSEGIEKIFFGEKQ